MEERIPTLHPQAKQGVNILKRRYEVIKEHREITYEDSRKSVRSSRLQAVDRRTMNMMGKNTRKLFNFVIENNFDYKLNIRGRTTQSVSTLPIPRKFQLFIDKIILFCKEVTFANGTLNE